MSLRLLSWQHWFTSYFVLALESRHELSPLGLCSVLPLKSRIPGLGTDECHPLYQLIALGFCCYQCLVSGHIRGGRDSPAAVIDAVCGLHEYVVLAECACETAKPIVKLSVTFISYRHGITENLKLLILLLK